MHSYQVGHISLEQSRNTVIFPMLTLALSQPVAISLSFHPSIPDMASSMAARTPSACACSTAAILTYTPFRIPSLQNDCCLVI